MSTRSARQRDEPVLDIYSRRRDESRMVEMLKRHCCRAGCGNVAVATLTYVHRDQTAVLGPLATFAEPHAYDLCAGHATRLTAPRGWDVVRLPIDLREPEPTPDDLLALADAVREAGRPAPLPPVPAESEELPTGSHLRVVRSR